jgi:hypothetical protein
MELEKQLQKAIVLSKDKFLVISTFKPFEIKANRGLLELLLGQETNFLFMDFPHLDKTTAPVLVEFMRRNSREVSRSSGGKKAKKQMPNPELTSKKTQNLARRKKKQRAYVNPINYKIRQEILPLLQKNLSRNEIARILNQKELRTANGSIFYAQTVARHDQTIEEMESFYDVAPETKAKLQKELEEDIRQTTMLGATTQAHVQVKNPENIEDKIQLLVQGVSEFEEIKVEILDNKGKRVFSRVFPPGTKDYSIDILKETTLFPGKHFLRIKIPGAPMKQIPIELFTSLRPY